MVKVNDEEVSYEDGSVKLNLSSNLGYEEYTIWATDMAGNTTEMTITVAIQARRRKLDRYR